MKKNNPYIILVRATISYMWKMHPYMMIWFASGIFAGIYTAITEKLLSSIKISTAQQRRLST